MTGDDQGGFSLVELLVAISVLGVVVGAVTSSIMVGLKTTDDTTSRLSESHDTQMSTAYFTGDVQSADDVATDVADEPCAGAGTTSVVRFSWTDPVDTTTSLAKTAAYVVSPAGSSTRELHRRYCEGSSLKSDVIVAHNLHPSTDPVVVCDPSCPGRQDAVSITVTEASSYTYTLAGTRRST